MKRIQSIKHHKLSLKDSFNSTSDDIVDDNDRKAIPIIRYSSKLNELDELDELDQKVLSLKISNYSKDFKCELEKVLALYLDEELKYSSKVVAFVIHEVERFILKPKSGTVKRSLVIDCCKKYFNNNDIEIVGVVIDLLFK